MDRDDILDRVLYGYFLEQLFSVATGRLDKLLEPPRESWRVFYL
ncbi:hypothetical protein EC121427_04719 [Escherichia coli O145:H28]|nr:hypothetical protein EC142179_03761 [Escherichia coli O145:H28]GEF01469.1 hypothetical protein ECo699_02094 [Escherichia coli O145:H28]GEG07591.1 hypothetical protein EC133313_04080 [Escherichia coli O145:H28]GEG24373.1 hypothetical protein EC153152_04956 [Escherichia coli O145:H28]GEG79803.1 hypothetical protein EC160509_03673 [Escherichia coli O145:H28]